MRPSTTDALSVLSADHRVVQELRADFDDLASEHAAATARRRLALQICRALTAHAVALEAVFYPALAEALEDDDLVDDALAGHDGLRALVEQVEAVEASDERFDTLMLMLASAMARHVRDVEAELFPRAQASGLDLDRLGARICHCRDESLRLLADEAA